MTRPRPSWLLSPLMSALVVLAPSAQEPVDSDTVAFLREQGLEHGQAMELLSWICDVYGPRLTGSNNLRHAQEWAKKTFEDQGLANVHFATWGPFGRGWELESFHADVVGDNPWPVLAWPKAWSPSVGDIEGDVILATAGDADALAAMDLADKIVLVEDARELSEPFEPLAERRDAVDLLRLETGARVPSPSRGDPSDRSSWRTRWEQRRAILQVLQDKHPLALLDRSSKGDYGTLFVQQADAARVEGERKRAWDEDADVVPQITLAVEHYNRLCRLLQKGQKVRMAISLRCHYLNDDPMQRNVLAEIPGTDEAIGDQVVMLGAHYDSWHSGTGATDNGAGSAVVMEAMRLLQQRVEALGHGPRRTIRAALWSGEEQGLLGSRAWVAQNLGTAAEPTPANAKLAAYFNLDNGTGRIRGIYAQSNPAVVPIFRAWLKPFWDLDATVVTLDDTGGTDHLSFDAVGVPGFQFVQDAIAYGSRTHHSNMDVWDHAIGDDLQQAATIMASFVWHAAQRDEPLPRKVAAAASAGGR